jgi:hypothetical protein
LDEELRMAVTGGLRASVNGVKRGGSFGPVGRVGKNKVDPVAPSSSNSHDSMGDSIGLCGSRSFPLEVKSFRKTDISPPMEGRELDISSLLGALVERFEEDRGFGGWADEVRTGIRLEGNRGRPLKDTRCLRFVDAAANVARDSASASEAESNTPRPDRPSDRDSAAVVSAVSWEDRGEVETSTARR